MHLKAFSQRFLANEPSRERIDFIYEQVQKNCKEEYECVKKVGAYMYKEYSRELPRQEELYLMIHIHKILGELCENS